MPKVGGRRKKLRSHKQPDVLQQMQTPKTFIFKKGQCSQQLKQLTLDIRKTFYPNTAMKLQDNKKMAIKSYLKAAKYYHVNHLITLQNLNGKQYIRFIKVGGGQMTFRIINFARMKDVLKNGGQPFSYSFRECLLVLNGFNENPQIRMVGRGIQELYPSLNLQKANTQYIKRVVSYTYRPKKKFIFFRQYKIIQHQGGVSNSFQKLLSKPKDLSSFKSLKQYLQSQNNQVQGTQNQQKLNLVEIGPRLKLKFVSYKENTGVLSQKDLQDAENQYKEQSQKYQKNHNQKVKRREGVKANTNDKTQNQQNQEVQQIQEQAQPNQNQQDQFGGIDQDQQVDEIDLQSEDQN